MVVYSMLKSKTLAAQPLSRFKIQRNDQRCTLAYSHQETFSERCLCTFHRRFVLLRM